MRFPVPQSTFFRIPCPPRLKRPLGSRACLPLAMASLERLWKEGRDGALSPLEQKRAWALRTAQRDIGGDKAVNLEKIADRVTKVGGGHPTREAIRQFLERVDADPEWYPGKNYRKRSGPQAVLQGKKRKQTLLHGQACRAEVWDNNMECIDGLQIINCSDVAVDVSEVRTASVLRGWSCAGGRARADERGRSCAGGRAGALSTGSAPY